MAVQIPLVLNGIVISELSPGDTLGGVYSGIPVFTRDGEKKELTLNNGPTLLITKRNSAVVNVLLEI